MLQDILSGPVILSIENEKVAAQNLIWITLLTILHVEGASQGDITIASFRPLAPQLPVQFHIPLIVINPTFA
jgi:hypothetical protein